jgi:hypothetical protein
MSLENKNPRRPIFQNAHWSFFAISDGLFKTVHMWLFKIIGSLLISLPLFFISTFIVGIIQIIGGLSANLRSRYEVFPRPRYIIGSLLLGVTALYTAIIPMYIFSVSDADIALIAFIISIILIPKALLDKFLYRDPITLIQLISIPLFLFGFYAIVGFPSIEQIKIMPFWAWLALSLPIVILIEELITRVSCVGVVSPWVKNFWIGVSTTILSFVAFIVLEPISMFSNILKNLPFEFWFLFIVLGLSILTNVFVRQRTFMYGGSVALKKITMISSYLISSLIVGILFFGNLLNFGEVLGVIALIAGYFFVEREAFSKFLSHLRSKNQNG